MVVVTVGIVGGAGTGLAVRGMGVGEVTAEVTG